MAGDPQQELRVALNDFPDFLGAMIVKELRQGVRGKMFIVPFLAIHIAMLVALGLDLTAAKQGGHLGSPSFFFEVAALGLDSQKAFWQVGFILLLIVMPWAGLSALSRERDGSNGELLLMAGLSRWKVVIGKWSVLCALGGLTAITMLPYLLVRYYLGGMNIPLTIAMAVSLMMMNAAANALAIGVSGYADVFIRITVALCAAGAFFVCGAIVVASSGYLASKIPTGGEIVAMVGGIIGVASTCFLYCAIGLQLGRIRIRPYERAFESATSGGVCALMILSPLLVGFATMVTAGFAGFVGALLLGWAVIAMDPNAKKRRPPKLYPPIAAENHPPPDIKHPPAG